MLGATQVAEFFKRGGAEKLVLIHALVTHCNCCRDGNDRGKICEKKTMYNE